MEEPTSAQTSDLWNGDINEVNYGSNYKTHIFEQYKLYVEMADQVSNRRNLANTFFLTLHTLLLGVVGFSIEKGSVIIENWMIIFPLSSALLLCLAWWMMVKSYRDLNRAKFIVIGEFEKRLPTSPYWCAEWKALGEGKDRMKYTPVSYIENWVPIIFAILYTTLAVVVLFR
jgi:hypothetical protein